MMQAMTFASMRHLDGNDHTRLQADDTSTSTIPSRYWSTTYWTPAQISGQFKSVSAMETYLAARAVIPMRAAAAPTAVNKHSPHIMWPHGVRVALVGDEKQIGHE